MTPTMALFHDVTIAPGYYWCACKVSRIGSLYYLLPQIILITICRQNNTQQVILMYPITNNAMSHMLCIVHLKWHVSMSWMACDNHISNILSKWVNAYN